MMRVIGKYLAATAGYRALLPTVLVVSPVLALFTRSQYREDRQYSWGGLYGTYDNPPQGDQGYVTKRAPFPNVTTGVRGWFNRTVWTIRNPLYNYKRKVSVTYRECTVVTIKGNKDISDKYRIPGWMFARAYCSQGRLIAFEWYSVTPWSRKRGLRVRIGWKIKGRKFDRPNDFAPLVFTINPFDGYGND